MANIVTFKKYIALLDEVFQESATSSVLDGDNAMVQKGAGVGEFVVPSIAMDGLADYDRQNGYKRGNANISYQTKKANYDRGRKFSIDSMDNEETAGLMFGKLASEFIRTKVAPELDAFRFAAYAGRDDVTKVAGSYKNGADALFAILKGTTAMDEDEVPQDSRYLFITPTLLALAKNVDTTKSKGALEGFASIIKVPQTRFYTKIKLLDGESAGEEKGGFKYDSDAKKINFMIVPKSAVIQFTKHSVNKIITPELNQESDAWQFHYRSYGISEVYENKAKGIYVSFSDDLLASE